MTDRTDEAELQAALSNLNARTRHAVQNWRDDRPHDVAFYPAYEARFARRRWIDGRWRYRLTALGAAVRAALAKAPQ